MGALQLFLLGAPQAQRDDSAIALSVRKIWGLLAHLAVEGRATRARLAGLLWPEVDEASARRNLRRELHRLREAGLGELIDGDEHLLRLGTVTCDLHEFRAALNDGHGEVALRLYRGALLDGLDVGSEPFDAWLRHQREQLHSLWQQAARAQMRALQASGDVRGALAIALQVLDVDALQEADYRSAMALHDRLGDREAALALYERCRRALGKELGLRPMAETTALAERIRRGDAPSDDASDSNEADAALLPLAPLVGRDEALAQLGSWVQSRAGASALAFIAITGPAGVGKSRLAREFAARYGETRRYAAQPGDTLVAYAAPARWLRERKASAATLPAPLHRELSHVLPELGYIGPPPDPASPRDRLFDALTQAWHTLAPSGAGVEIFDDLHWLDAASADWLFYLLTRGRAGQPPALCLARGEELPQETAAQLRTFASAGVARTLALPHLASEGTLDLVRRLSGSTGGERFAARLHQATGGHPLFLLETMRHLLDTGWVRIDAEGQWHTPVDDRTTDYAELPVPASVRDAILARAERLGEAPRRLLDAASCLRRPVRFESIARATALSEWEAVQAFELIRAAHLMDADQDETYRFTHDLIGQTLLDALSPERRRLLNRALAATLAQAQSPGVPAADIAQHWQDGGEPALASPWWERAAQQAEELGAQAEACAYVDKALRQPASLASEVALHLRYARLLDRLADPAGRREAIDRAERAARASGDAALMAQAQLRRATALGPTDLAQATVLVDEVLAQSGLSDLLKSTAYQQRAMQCRLRGDIDACVANCDTALALLPLGHWRSRAELLQLRGIVLKFIGQSDLAQRGLKQAIDAAQRSGDDVTQVRALVSLASTLADDGDAAASRRMCEDALVIARRTHDVGVQRSAYLNLLRALVAQGELATAAAMAQEAMDLSPRYTTVSEEQALTEARFVLALMAGELGTAFDAAPALLDVSRRAGELWRRVSGLLAPVDAWLLLDSRRDDAGALVDECEDRLRGSDINLMRLAVAVRRAELTLLRGDAAAAAALIAPVVADPALRSQDVGHAQRVLALARHALGEPAELAASTPDMNPEPATLNAATRLRIDPTTLDEALAWFDSGRAPPLEALHLALALCDALPARRRADRQRVADAARALATRLHASLARHAPAQADFQRQFAPLF